MEILTDIFKVILCAVGSFAVLFLLMRINGKRQVSELSMFDYVNGITIGSIAAEMATALEDFYKPLIAMAVYTLLVLGISVLTDKNMRFRRFAEGSPRVLLQDGAFDRAHFKKGHLDMDEFLTQCRTAGYFDISEIQKAVLEPNGKISFLPYAQYRPATPADVGIAPTANDIPIVVVSDGVVLPKRLQELGKDESYLQKMLKSQKISDVHTVFAATCNRAGDVRVYRTTSC